MMTIVHFTVDYEGLTKLIRGFWAEGDFHRAETILTEGGLPMDIAYEIIRGNLKLAQDPEDENQGKVVVDDWKPEPGYGWLGYPDPADVWVRTYQQEYGQRGIQRAKNLCELIMRSINAIEKYNLAGELREEGYTNEFIIWLGYPGVVKLLQKRAREITTWNERRDGTPNANVWDVPTVPGAPTLDQYVKHQLDLNKEADTPPHPDTEFARPLGFILPNGKFYSCEWMDHRWLAIRLGLEQWEMASKSGWIEITHPLGQPEKRNVIYGRREPTEAQITTLFDWKRVWGEPHTVTDWMGVEESEHE